MFLHEQTGFFSLLLWVGSGLCFIAYGLGVLQEEQEQTGYLDKSNLYLGIVLSTVVFITGVFSYMQTSKAASLMDNFKNFIPKEALVMRNGTWAKIESRLMVPGDIVKIKGGDNVPADMILFSTNEMKVNNASLTGEPEELLRKVDIKTQNIFESPNVAFFGTMCTAGLGQGVVFRTGDDTVIGRIANLSESAEKNQTPLSIEIERFIFIVSAVAIFLGVTFFFIGWIVKGADIVTNLVFCIGIIVANVPEGLLATVTVSLALTASRMAKKKVLVKNLESVETLGSTSCICSDKTGTLTQNRMTVSQMYYNMEIVDCGINWELYQKAKAKEEAKGEEADMKKVQVPKYDFSNAEFRELVKTMALSTTSIFAYQPPNEEIRARTAVENKVNIAKVPKDPEPESAGYEDYLRVK